MKKIIFSVMAVLLVVISSAYATIAVFAATHTTIREDAIRIEYATTDDLWNSTSKCFYFSNVNKLLQKISGDGNVSTSNMEKIDQMAVAENDFNIPGSDAENFRKNAGEDIVVTLGGLTWHACYLSKDKQNNTILTLWLTSSKQDAWKDQPAALGDYFGCINGSLYSDWAANWVNASQNLPRPNNLYGTSYIRAVTLNNGGIYATSNTEVSSYQKDKNNLFAMFTMEEFEIINYIVKPLDVEWQECKQFAKDMIGASYNYSNENWSSDTKKVPDTGFYFNSDYNYAHKGEYNSAWSNDFLWLPSRTEIGRNSDVHGIWQLNVLQRANGTLSSDSSVGKVGQTSDDAKNNTWLRTSGTNPSYSSYATYPHGSNDYPLTVNHSYAVRPALHLNLTKIANELNA